MSPFIHEVVKLTVDKSRFIDAPSFDFGLCKRVDFYCLVLRSRIIEKSFDFVAERADCILIKDDIWLWVVCHGTMTGIAGGCARPERYIFADFAASQSTQWSIASYEHSHKHM
jgi:hypothetical protein